MDIQLLIFYAGIVQLLIVAGSLSVPVLLQWNHELSVLKPFYRQMFFTYAGYILACNLFFGLVPVSLAGELAGESNLSGFLNGFIALYWISRLLIQFCYFDRRAFPRGPVYLISEVILCLAFGFLAFVYASAFFHQRG